MKKSMIFIFIIIFSFCLFAQTPVLPLGSGTTEDPFQIECYENLLWISYPNTINGLTHDQRMQKHYFQTDDIVIPSGSTYTWRPIGKGITEDSGMTTIDREYFFEGVYDGNSHSISNLHAYNFSSNQSFCLGFFGGTSNAIIKNINLINVSFIDCQGAIGALCGISRSTIIENCSTTGIINNSTNYIQAGIVKVLDNSTIRNSYSECTNSSFEYLPLISLIENHVQIINSFYPYNEGDLISFGALNQSIFNNWKINKSLPINEYLSNDGTYYLINNLNDFNYLKVFGTIPGNQFLLTNDLDFEETPLNIPFFNGTLNGNNHSISNFTGSNLSFHDNVPKAIFSYVSNATLSNITLNNLNMYSDTYTLTILSSFAGKAINSTFNSINAIECSVNEQNTFGYTGGLFGIIDSCYVNNCSFSGSVYSNSLAGGLMNEATHSFISNSFTNAAVHSKNSGGLARHMSYTEISECYTNGSVVATNSNNCSAGGILSFGAGLKIIDSYSNCTVSGINDVGGIIGSITSGSIIDCYATGQVNGTINVGGIVGRCSSLGYIYVKNTYFTGNINAQNIFGALIGLLDAHVENCFYNQDEVLINNSTYPLFVGAISSSMFNEWLNNGKHLNIDNYMTSENGEYLITDIEDLTYLKIFGQFKALSFKLCNDLDLSDNENMMIPYFRANFNGNRHIIQNFHFNIPNQIQAGFFAYIDSAAISNIGFENSSVTGKEYVGGIIGLMTCNSTLSNSFFSGTVTGDSYVGGITGLIKRGSLIQQSYSAGMVYGIEYVGGFVGKNSEATIINCYSRANVRASVNNSSYLGAFMYRNDGNVYRCYSTGSCKLQNGTNVPDAGFCYWSGIGSNMSSNYWDIETSEQSSSNYNAQGKTTAEMKNINTFTNWDFDTIWQRGDNLNDGYLSFQWQGEALGNQDVDINPVFYSDLLHSAYPNPFNPSTTIVYELANDGDITLDIFNIKGQKVITLINDFKNKGKNKVIWNAEDDHHNSCSSGIYFVRMRTKNTVQTHKIILMK